MAPPDRDGRPVLVVDAANVVGARPDGWWRDRPAAARRLLDALARAAPPEVAVVVVLEGQARAAAADGEYAGLLVSHAEGCGDDRIVHLVAAAVGPRRVRVVTADRGLLGRVRALGADTAGPGALWRALDQGTWDLGG